MYTHKQKEFCLCISRIIQTYTLIYFLVSGYVFQFRIAENKFLYLKLLMKLSTAFFEITHITHVGFIHIFLSMIIYINKFNSKFCNIKNWDNIKKLKEQNPYHLNIEGNR